MEFHVLGPLEILSDGKPIPLDAPKQRAILADLLVHANEVVSTDRLVDDIWGDDGSVGTLRYHISKLREGLNGEHETAEDVIATRAPGYMLDVDPEQVDALEFESLIEEARRLQSSDPETSLALFDEALLLWHGDPYAEFAFDGFADLERERLVELRRGAIEDRMDLLLGMGRHVALLPELEALTSEHPTRERLWGQLALALYCAGRQADAVAAFGQLRDQLTDVGLDLTPQLKRLEDRILTQDGTLLVEAAAPDRLRGYALRGQIGEGAQGVVWRAAQPGVGREVAIKAIRPELANQPAFIRRFEAEAQLVAALEHPHIVSLFDFWRDPDGAYLVMPYLRGGDLSGVIHQGPLESAMVLDLVASIGSALSHAHKRGVVHRDVTPHNILFDEDGNPYLADFGMAGLLGAEGPPVTSSPAYMSPEQAAGAKAVVQSDVYSLGVLVHSALTGRIPAVDEPLPPVVELRHDLSVDVDNVIACATAPNIEQRYPDVSEFMYALAHAVGVGREDAPVLEIEERNPYKGLRAFEENDAGDFFGREMLVTELVQSVSRHRLVGVVGPSGCGKSSLIRAGVIPVLRRGALPGSERWLITDMYPGTEPLAELEAALLRVAVNRPAGLGAGLMDADADLRAMLDDLLPRDAELLLLVDQFEELFTLTTAEEPRRRFLDLLLRLATDPTLRVRVVVTMRADFYDRPLEYPQFGELLRRGLVSITMPAAEQLRDAITGPAGRVGLSVDEALVEAMVHDVADQPGGLPLLEYALTELFERRTEDRLSLDGYEKTAGVMGALGRRAEDLYSQYDGAGKAAAQQVFLRLVTVEEGSEDTRRRIPLTELQGLGIEENALQAVLDDFGEHRLLTFDRDPETREPTVEVAHEALLSRWDRLRGWIDERRDDLVLYRRLATAVMEWDDSSRQHAYLFSGGRLEHYEAFAEETDIALSTDEVGFLRASRKAADEADASRRKRRRLVLTAFASAAVIAAVLAVVASLAQQRAEDAQQGAEDARAQAEANAQDATDQAARADAAAADAVQQKSIAEANEAVARAQELVAETRLAMREDPELAILLALEAVALDGGGGPLKEAVDVLHEMLITSRVRLTTPASLSAGVSGDGGLIATKSAGEPVEVIRVADRATVLELPLAGDTYADELSEFSVAISPDGRLLVTGRTDGTVAVWDVATGDEVVTTNDLQQIWVDATGGTFTLAYGESTTSPLTIDATPSVIEAALEGLAEIDDVSILGAGATDNPWQVTLADTSSPFVRRLAVDTSELGPRPGTVIVESSEDFALLSIEADSGSFVFSLDDETSDLVAFDATAEQVEAAVEGLSAMPDLVVSGEAGFFELAPSNEGEALPPFTATAVDLSRPGDAHVAGRGHDHPTEVGWGFDGAHSLEFSPDGTVLASRGWDGTIRLWDVPSGEQLHILDAPLGPFTLRGVAFSPDGTLLAATDGGDLTWVWDTGLGTLLHTHEVPDQDATDVAFRGDGEAIYIARSFGDWGIGIWDLNTGEEQALSGSGFGPATIAVNHDGSVVAAGDVGGEVTLFEVVDHGLEPIETLALHRQRIWDLSFANYSNWLLSVDDTDVRLSDLGVSGSSEWMTLRGSEWGFPSVAYSPDGTMLARGPVDGDIVIVDALSGEELVVLAAGAGSVADMDFSPGGALLAAAVTEGAGFVQVWDMATQSLIAQPVKEEKFIAGSEWHDSASVDFSPDGRYLAAAIGHADTTPSAVRVWESATFEQVLALDSAEGSPVEFKELAFTPDGEQLAVRGTFDGVDTVRFYDLDGNLIQTCCKHYWARFTASIAFSPDGSLMVTSGMDFDTGEGTVEVWDAATGRALVTLEGHPDAAYDAVFSPDGTLIASGGSDIRVWDAATYEEIVQLKHGENALVYELAFSPDGSRLVSTGDWEGVIRVWALDVDDLIQIAQDRLTRTFTAAECEIYDIDPCPTLE